MMSRRYVLLILAALWVTASVEAQISVGRNVLVTSDAPDLPHFEMILAADPAHPDRLMACSMVMSVPDVISSDVATYVSFDRGQSWRRSLVVRGHKRDRGAWDPDCTYGPDGVAYTIAEAYDSAARPYVQIDRSTDGGKTWDRPSQIKHFERLFVAADHNQGARRGWLYFHGQAGMRTTGGVRRGAGGVGLHLSRDGGRSVTVTNIVAAGGNDYVVAPGPGVVLSDGTFAGVFGEFRDYWQPDGSTRIQENVLGRTGSAWANGSLKVVTVAPDSSAAYLAPTVVNAAEWFSPWPGWNKSVLPSLAADASDGPFKDRLYLTWADVRSGWSEVYLSYSADSGKTWSAPRRVSDDGFPAAAAKKVDHLHGVVAVNPQGVVGVCWYDRRDHSDNLSWTVRCTASLDGADTFLPSVSVSEVPYVQSRSDRMWLSAMQRQERGEAGARVKLGVHSFNFSGGHTVGLAADAAGGFHPLWTGNPGGVPQLWTAMVSVPGRAAKNGGGALADLSDVSDKIAVIMVNATYVPKQRRLEGEIYLENTSKDTIAGPFILRVLDIDSELGVARLANADNRRSGPGAIYDFTALVPQGRLAPGERSGRKRIRIEAKLLEPLRPTVDAVVGVAVLTSKILATPSPPPPVSATASTSAP